MVEAAAGHNPLAIAARKSGNNRAQRRDIWSKARHVVLSGQEKIAGCGTVTSLELITAAWMLNVELSSQSIFLYESICFDQCFAVL